MLINCPECQLQISDKAFSCPHCGFPLKDTPKSRHIKSSNKRKKLPNGFGQISELKNKNLRKRFRAMVSIGKNEYGKPITKLLRPEAYFSTYKEAYEALLEYHKNPYDLNSDILVIELYDKWTNQYFQTLKSNSSERTITSAWKYCSSVYYMRVKDIRARHIKGCMENGIALVKGKERTPTANIKSRIKSLFNLMLDYAVEYEIVDRNYARTFDISDNVIKEREEAKRDHIPFTDDEINIMWNNVSNVPYVDIVLIQCYAGWRPQELGLIELENVDLENETIIGGMKTEAGTNRVVPIHPKIMPLIKRRYDEAVALGSKYLINCTDTKTHRNSLKFTYDKYRQRFSKIIDILKLNSEHKPHDGRKHFITIAKKYNVDEYAIKYIVGHSINDITERVYTQREIKWLKTEMKKIK